MVNPGPDEPTHGSEYLPLEKSPPPVDPYAPVDYPSDTGTTPLYPPPPGYPQTGYPPPGYEPSGYPPPGLAPPGYPPFPPPSYPGAYAYGYDPYAPARPAGTNGKAIASLVTSLAGLLFCGLPSIVGLILGIIAMRETKRTGQEGHGMALAGVIVGALAAAGWLLYAIVIAFAIAVTSTSPYGY
jgi:hypothetical protein